MQAGAEKALFDKSKKMKRKRKRRKKRRRKKKKKEEEEKKEKKGRIFFNGCFMPSPYWGPVFSGALGAGGPSFLLLWMQ